MDDRSLVGLWGGIHRYDRPNLSSPTSRTEAVAENEDVFGERQLFPELETDDVTPGSDNSRCCCCRRRRRRFFSDAGHGSVQSQFSEGDQTR